MSNYQMASRSDQRLTEGHETGQRIGETLQAATVALKEVGADSPRLDAELLLAHCLQRDRAYLLAHPEQTLSSQQQTEFARLLARRVAREPLAYITGRRWFYGLKFVVGPAVLIPRPETEMLVEAALEWLGQRPQVGVSMIDVGTGSGTIAIAVAAHSAGDVHIYASDQSADALEIAQDNAHTLVPDKSIHFLHGDLLAALPQPIDMIVANLPYVAEEQRSGLMPEVRDYEPALALFGGADGLREIERLLAQSPAHLKPGGAILLEIGYDQGQSAMNLARRIFPAADIRIRPDLAGLDRLLLIQTPA